MFIKKSYFTVFLLITTFFIFSIAVFGQQFQNYQSTPSDSITSFSNPLLLNNNQGCRPENLNPERFDRRLDTNQRMIFCQAFQNVSIKLRRNWSPALRTELQQIWQVFTGENVKIHPLDKNEPSNLRGYAKPFDEDTTGRKFNAGLYFRPSQVADRAFFPVVMHELRHVFDLYTLWKNKTSITEAELEKRAFRLEGKISQELTDNKRYSGLPEFWKESWKQLPAVEIAQKREAKIEKFMRSNRNYKNLLKTPEKNPVGYAPNRKTSEKAPDTKKTNGEKLPTRLKIRQTENELPQQVKEVSFEIEKAVNKKNTDELLRAALRNEKNLYYKMDNFVYDQNLQLQCWKKQKVTENYELTSSIARTQTGEALSENENISSNPFNLSGLPSCILDLETIKSDATDTFWAAPYLDQMKIEFTSFTVVDGIPVARYTVFEPSLKKFNQIAARYPNIKIFRAFVGTIFVSVEDSQIIRFWGTSFPTVKATGYQSPKVSASYNATAIRQKLASGIWVTTLLNTVAVTNKNNVMKPFSYVVKYQNYRQGTTDVVILDDETAMVSAK